MRLTRNLPVTLLCAAAAIILTAKVDAQNPILPTELPLAPAEAPLESQDEATESTPAQGSGKSFQQIVDEIQKNENKINRMFSTIPIGFPDEQRKHMEKIKALRAANEQLEGEMEAAARDAYQAEETRTPQVARMVYNSLIKKLDVTRANPVFDPEGALEIADMMLDTGLEDNPIPQAVTFQDVAYQTFRASFALQDFERAGLMLEKIEAKGIPLIATIKEELVDSREKWQKELMIRRLESNADDLPRVKLETTEGDIVVELFENHAPQTVGNFISLVEKNFYEGMDFFLVVPAQFARTGCPNGDGSGDAGYKIYCECYGEQIRHHFSGTISMHNSGRDTGGSQFFITHQRTGMHDGKHTAFGRVIEGMDVVYRLQMFDQSNLYEPTGVEPSKLIKATVIRKRDHPYVPSQVGKKSEDSAGVGFPDSLDSVENLAPGG